MYYRSVPMTLEEAVKHELLKGFDTRDEYNEVMKELAYEYNVMLAEVIMMVYNVKNKGDLGEKTLQVI